MLDACGDEPVLDAFADVPAAEASVVGVGVGAGAGEASGAAETGTAAGVRTGAGARRAGATRRAAGRGFGRRGAARCAGRTTSGVMTIGVTARTGATCLAGSPAARMMAGCDAAAGTANACVCEPPGPARSLGNAETLATAPASRTPATTPLVIALMVAIPTADGITRTRYRQVRTKA